MNPKDSINHTCISANVSKIKAEYLEHFQKLVENITIENLDKFCMDNGNEEINIKLDTVKNELFNSIVCEFDRVWKTFDINNSLRCIEALKLYDKTKENAWRPTHKTVIEQTKCYRIQMHKVQIAYLEQKIMQQNKSLESLIIDLEEKRKCIDDIVKKRKFIQNQMNVRKKQFIESKTDVKKLLLKNLLTK